MLKFIIVAEVVSYLWAESKGLADSVFMNRLNNYSLQESGVSAKKVSGCFRPSLNVFLWKFGNSFAWSFLKDTQPFFDLLSNS